MLNGKWLTEYRMRKRVSARARAREYRMKKRAREYVRVRFVISVPEAVIRTTEQMKSNLGMKTGKNYYFILRFIS